MGRYYFVAPVGNDGCFCSLWNTIQEEKTMKNYCYKTITELSKIDGRVYVYLPTPEIAKKFAQHAESEAFVFTDGVKPT